MAESREALSEAIAMETEATEGIGAAKAEQDLGQPALSLDLLKEAIEKERASLDLLEDGVETLRQALEQRRQALDQQGELLDEIIGALSAERR
jgi:hypothetical protein